MKIIASFLFVIVYMVILDIVYGLIGVQLMRFSYEKHPRIYRLGVRMICMCTILPFLHNALPGKCKLPCDGSCRNWTCPKFDKI